MFQQQNISQTTIYNILFYTDLEKPNVLIPADRVESVSSPDPGNCRITRGLSITFAPLGMAFSFDFLTDQRTQNLILQYNLILYSK